MALLFGRPREGEMERNLQSRRTQSIQHNNRSPGRRSRPSHNHSYRSNVIGNLKEGQGYADRRKRKFLNNYQKLKRKQRIQAERKLGENENDAIPNDINLFAQKIGRENADEIKASSVTDSKVERRTHKDAVEDCSEQLGERTEEREEKKKRFKKRGGKKNNKNRFSKAQHQFNEKRRSEELRLQTIKQQQTERAQALERYSKKKMEQHQKLKKKTRRGQPLMKYHMEALLDKIKAQGT